VTAAVAAGERRLAGLDGIRGLAALFVVVNHIFLRAFPGYPADRAPPWAAGFIYGRFAVVVFIVLSGFSLSLSPARHGWRLGGVAAFARRRAWRILPPYWAALAFSLLMTWMVVAQPGWPRPTGKSVIANALLVQDAVPAPSPNRAFWSIAIEAQLYVVLPLLVLAVRRVNRGAPLAIVGVPVFALGGCAAAHVGAAQGLVDQYTPDLAVLFAVGVVAASLVGTAKGRRRGAWGVSSVALVAPVLVLIAVRGAVWTNTHLFWVDLALGPAIGCFLVAVASIPAAWFVRLLDLRPLRSLGGFSYSLYLTHMPIVIAAYFGMMQGHVGTGGSTFLVLCAVIVPLTVAFARLFAEVFELPFQRRRGWSAIRPSRPVTPQPTVSTTSPA
jgi:peptidoglycan/LPS O-acetylase OafA/YrhL